MDNEFKVKVERLSDEAAIRNLIYTHCWALDRCDQVLLASLYHDDAMHIQGPFQGLATHFIESALTKFRDIESGSHHITNVLIEIEGCFAKAESYYLGFARVRRGADGVPLDRIVTGRNLDIIDKRDGIWKISSRYVVYDSNQLVRGTADSEDSNLPHYSPWGRRDDSDIAYKFRAVAADAAEWWDL